MAIRPASKRPAQRIDELLEKFDRINAERSLLGLPRVDPFDGLDLTAPALDDLDGTSFGSLPLRNPRRAPGRIIGSGGSSLDRLGLLDSMIFEDDPISVQAPNRRASGGEPGIVRPPQRRLPRRSV